MYRFYSELIRQYPDLDSMSDEEMESSPWAASLEVAGDHVVMALLWNQHAQVYEFVLRLANVHGLVCFDPQAQKVHLPGGSQVPVPAEPVAMEVTSSAEISTSGWVSAGFAPVSLEQPRAAWSAPTSAGPVGPQAATAPEPAEASSLRIAGPAKTAYETVAKMVGCKLVFEETPDLEQALSQEVTVRIPARLNQPEDRPAFLALTLISMRSHTAFLLAAAPDGGCAQDWTLTVSARLARS